MTPNFTSKRLLARTLHEATSAILPGAEVVAEFRRREAGLERLMRPELHRVLEDLGGRVAGASVAQGLSLVESAANPGDAPRIDRIVAAAQIESWKIAQLKPIFEKHWRRTALAVIESMEKYDYNPTQRDKVAEKVLLSGGKRIGLVDIEGDTKRALLSIVNVGRQMGLSPRKTAVLIEQAVPRGRFTLAGKQYRASMIARTETMSAAREASLSGYRAARTVEKVVAFDGEEFDETCASRNGEFFTIEEAELENGDTHPNCVLAWGPA